MRELRTDTSWAVVALGSPGVDRMSSLRKPYASSYTSMVCITEYKLPMADNFFAESHRLIDGAAWVQHVNFRRQKLHLLPKEVTVISVHVQACL